MKQSNYELEMAYRIMEEFQQWAERQRMIQEFKKSRSDLELTPWWKVIASSLFQPGQLLIKMMFKPIFSGQSAGGARDKKSDATRPGNFWKKLTTKD